MNPLALTPTTRPAARRARRRGGWRAAPGAFSLIELVLVVVMLAVIGAIALPRMSRGAAGAASSALQGDLAVLRVAIDQYQAEHNGAFPGNALNGGGTVAADPVAQLTGYTDDHGAVSPTGQKSSTYPFGPYLRSVPPLPVGTHKNQTGVAVGLSTALPISSGLNDGWVYQRDSGQINANTTAAEVDDKNNAYNQY